MKSRLLILLGCMLVAMGALAENTKTISVTFADFEKGSSYADNEKHDLGDGLVIYTTDCYFTTELRIYSSTEYNGYVISDPLPGTITNMSFKMGHSKKEVLDVYGSTDKENWTLIKKAGIETTSASYKNYTLDFPAGANYTCFKLDVRGSKQIRIKSLSVTYVSSGSDGSNDEEDEVFTVSAPIFTPGSSTFSTESLDVTISAAEGCDIYYTTDGSEPSYTNANEYIGTKGDVATIYNSNSPVTLKAIAVDSATGKCSNVSSATYTYLFVENNGSKTKPYTVAEVKAMPLGINKDGMWVKGIIYGTVKSNINNIETTDFTEKSNMVIGDAAAYMPIQLPSGSIRNEINLKDHPYLQGKEILMEGTLESYFTVVGLKAPTRYQITYDVHINSYGYATLFLDMPVTVPSGCNAYYCTIEGEYASLLPVGSVIPDSVGVIIEAEPNTTCTLTYTTNGNSNEGTIIAENLLVGFTADTDVAVDGYAYYALNVKENELGFYIPQTATDATDAAGGFTAKAHKAYLRVPKGQKAMMFLFHRKNDETAIVSAAYMSDDTIYDLQGRVVDSPVRGMYIKAGKKVIIR